MEEGVLLRVLHVSPGTPPLDVYIDGRLFASRLSYGNISAERRVRCGSVQVKVLVAEDTKHPVILRKLWNYDGTSAVLAVCDRVEHISLCKIGGRRELLFRNRFLLRLVNLAPDSPLISLSAEKELFENIGFLCTGGYKPVRCGRVSVKVFASVSGEVLAEKEIDCPTLSSGTLFLIGGCRGDRGYDLLFLP